LIHNIDSIDPLSYEERCVIAMGAVRVTAFDKSRDCRAFGKQTVAHRDFALAPTRGRSSIRVLPHKFYALTAADNLFADQTTHIAIYIRHDVPHQIDVVITISLAFNLYLDHQQRSIELGNQEQRHEGLPVRLFMQWTTAVASDAKLFDIGRDIEKAFGAEKVAVLRHFHAARNAQVLVQA
jgi:hypothetical protein